MKRIILAISVCLLAGAPARADCDHFKWSVARELALFKAAPAALPAEGGSAAPGAGYELALAKDVKLPIPPERAPGKDTSAAVVTVPKLDAGAYQITLSAEAWIDVGQNGALVKSSAFSGQKDCPGVRKSVRFDLAAGPTTIEISNVSADKIMLAIAPAQ